MNVAFIKSLSALTHFQDGVNGSLGVLAVEGVESVEEEHGQGIDTVMEALVPILCNLK